MLNKDDIRRSLKRFVATVLNKTGVIERRLNQGGVIILMLHKVNNNNKDSLSLTIPPHILDQILTELKKRCEIIPLESAFDRNGRLISTGRCKVAITFDDGYKDNYEQAYPILKKHNVPATIYLSLGHFFGKYFFWYEKLATGILETKLESLDLTDIGSNQFNLKTDKERESALNILNLWLKIFTNQVREEKLKTILARLSSDDMDQKVSPMLTLPMVKEMLENKVSFGSHTISHPILSREDKRSIESEVIDSKQQLEEMLDIKVQGFAYPNGTEDDFNEIVVNCVEQAKYQHACTTVPGINYTDQNPFLLKRINIDMGMCSNERGDFLRNLFWAKVTSVI